LSVKVKESVEEAKDIKDYDLRREDLPGLNCEEIDGE
jgi:hypothetical protein